MHNVITNKYKVVRPYLNKKAINIAMTLYTVKIAKKVTSTTGIGEKMKTSAIMMPNTIYGIAIKLRSKRLLFNLSVSFIKISPFDILA